MVLQAAVGATTSTSSPGWFVIPAVRLGQVLPTPRTGGVAGQDRGATVNPGIRRGSVPTQARGGAVGTASRTRVV
jgi:hypothetical protein